MKRLPGLVVAAAAVVLSAAACEGGSAEGEGEGDVVSEGEGDVVSEGEGDVVSEGEGDVVSEGEGDVVAEGEGDVVGEGEGEGGVVAAGDVTVWLIGNSQLGFFTRPPAPPDVTRALEDVSTAAYGGATHLIVDKAQIEGTGCDGFLSATGPGSPSERAGSGEYDYVILLPSIGEGAGNAGCWDAFKAIAEDAGATFGIMATAHVSSQYPTGFDNMDAAMRTYTANNNLLFIPAGAIWRRLLGDNPGNSRFEFYGGDDAHPGGEGSYIYVLALYGAISGRSVVGLPVDSEPLRCLPDQSCLSYADLDTCVDDQNLFHCSAQNGALFDGNGQPTFISAAEALTYQQTTDAVLAER